jgi:hypothetical protein
MAIVIIVTEFLYTFYGEEFIMDMINFIVQVDTNEKYEYKFQSSHKLLPIVLN